MMQLVMSLEWSKSWMEFCVTENGGRPFTIIGIGISNQTAKADIVLIFASDAECFIALPHGF